MAPDTVWLRGETGALCAFSLPLPEGVDHRLGRGDLVRVNEDGSPWEAPGGAEPQVPDLPDAPSLPSVKANRAVWAEFAVSQGMDREKAATMTKAQLVEEFTRLRAAS